MEGAPPAPMSGAERRERQRLRAGVATMLASPRGLVAVAACLVLAVAVIELVVGSARVGVHEDSPIKVASLRTWLETGWYYDGPIGEGGDPPADTSGPYVYGPAFSLAGHALNVLVGNEAPGTVVESPASYRVLHLTTAMLGFLGALATGLTIWCITRSRLVALWGAAALLAIPAWLGYSFFHAKDVPAGAGYTLLTAGLVLGLSRREERPARRMASWGSASLVAAGVFFGVGTRPALWLPFAISFAVFALLVVLRIRPATMRVTAVVPVLIGTVVGAGTLAALQPKLATHPLAFLSRSVGDSADYAGTFTLTAGELLPGTPPRWYVPVWVGATLPILIGALAAFGTWRACRSLVWPLARRSISLRRVAERDDIGVALVLVQCLTLPLAMVLAGTTNYGGVLKVLFVFPPIAALAAYGISRPALDGTRGRARAWALAVLAASAVVVPTVEQLQLFPYNASYVNAVAGINGIGGVWEVATLGPAGREAIRHVPERGQLVQEPLLRAGYYEDERGRAARKASLGPDEYWLIQRNRSTVPLPRNCTPFDDVTRRFRGEDVVFARVARCTRIDDSQDDT